MMNDIGSCACIAKHLWEREILRSKVVEKYATHILFPVTPSVCLAVFQSIKQS
jgi:hypothetical protein